MVKELIKSCGEVNIHQIPKQQGEAIKTLKDQLDNSLLRITGRGMTGISVGGQPPMDPSVVPEPPLAPEGPGVGAPQSVAVPAPGTVDVPSASADPDPLPEPSGSTNKRRMKKGRKKYICEVCGKECGRKNDLESHLWKAHDQGTKIECSLCNNKKFASKRSLKQHHNRVHLGKFLHVCKKKGCKYGTDSKMQMQDHLNKHKYLANKKPRIWKCEKCEHTFIGLQLYEQHRRNIKCKSNKMYQCNICEVKWYKYPSSLSTHIALEHTGEKEKYQCVHCSNFFSYKGSLINHMALHRRTAATRKSWYRQAVRRHNRRAALKDFVSGKRIAMRNLKSGASAPAKLHPSASPKKAPRPAPTTRPSGRAPAKAPSPKPARKMTKSAQQPKPGRPAPTKRKPVRKLPKKKNKKSKD